MMYPLEMDMISRIDFLMVQYERYEIYLQFFGAGCPI